MNYANAIKKLELTLKRQEAAIAATKEQIGALQHLNNIALDESYNKNLGKMTKPKQAK